MKLICPLILLLNVHFLKGQQRKETYQPIFLNFTFDSAYNNNGKYCCKLFPQRCDKLMDSIGYTHESLKGRVTTTRGPGWIEFKISNVQLEDAGQYRCLVKRYERYAYRDYNVQLSIAPTIKPCSSSATFPQSTASVLTEDHRSPWSFHLLLIIIVSMAATLLIICVIGGIFFKVRKLEKRDELPRESSKQEATDPYGIVYTTVNYRAHPEQAKKHENPRTHEPLAEYSVLACHQ